MPAPLQLALIGREFDDVIVFTGPPRPIQKAAMAVLAPLARARGYQAIYLQYLVSHDRVTPDPSVMAAYAAVCADLPMWGRDSSSPSSS
jgi:hypothetical protein